MNPDATLVPEEPEHYQRFEPLSILNVTLAT